MKIWMLTLRRNSSGKINKKSPDCSSQVSLWIQFGLFLYNFKIAWKIEQEENDMDRKNAWTTYSKEELDRLEQVNTE